jgi:hypothetical protein
MNRKITDKVKIAIDYLEKQGFQEIPVTQELSLKHVHEQFYVVCDDSFNGIALVTFNLNPARRFTVQYINNKSRIITLKNDNNDTQIGVDTRTGLLILSHTKKYEQPVNIISPMWYKYYKKSLFSYEKPPRLNVITNKVPGIAPSPVAAPVVRPVAPPLASPAPFVQTSNRMGGRARRKTRKIRKR